MAFTCEKVLLAVCSLFKLRRLAASGLTLFLLMTRFPTLLRGGFFRASSLVHCPNLHQARYGKLSIRENLPNDRGRWRLDGQVALVTGGTKGIGRGIAEQLLQVGAQVIITARTQVDIDETTNIWEQKYGKVCVASPDLGNLLRAKFLELFATSAMMKVVSSLSRLSTATLGKR